MRIPKHTGWGAHYEKFVRVAHQWPIVAVAADGEGLDRRGARRTDQHGLHAAAGDRAPSRPSPVPARRRTAYARRRELAAEGTNPPSDLNGAADYRQHLARVLTGRAVLKAAGA